MDYKELPLWFRNRLKKIMEHNNYEQSWITADTCEKNGKWSPADLIAREYYNNGGGSSKGFLGLTTSECLKAFDYMRDNQETLKDMGLYSKDGYSNFGFQLWSNWILH